MSAHFTLEELELLWNAVRAITARYRGKPEHLQTVRFKLNELLYEARVVALREEYEKRSVVSYE